MREITFRGKRVEVGKLVSGSYLQKHYGDGKIGPFIVEHHPENNMDYGLDRQYEVDISTIGQFTGLKDKNGKEIYEGDIITQGRLHPTQLGTKNFQIFFSHGCFWVGDGEEGSVLYECLKSGLEVIGNIYEHPELLPSEDSQIT